MGGNAFKNLLPTASFPRMHPTVYDTLKSHLQPILETLYTEVAVAPEAPGKPDFGDLDFIVTGPREGLTTDEVQTALRATCSVPMDGHRISNYAIPTDAFPEVLEALKSAPGQETGSGSEQDGGQFFQVDINACVDHAHLERTVFYTSYADFGFILGLLAHTAGLSFGHYGLRLADPVAAEPAQTYYLSTSLSDILTFFGLSIDKWKEGFTSQEDIFKWAAASPFALPLVARYRAPDYTPSSKYARPLRTNFVTFLQTHDVDNDNGPSAAASTIFAVPGNDNIEEKVQAALQYFGKQEEHAKLLHLGRAQRRARQILNGTNVQEWTGMKGMAIRFIMDEVKERLSPSNGAGGATAATVSGAPEWQDALLKMPDEEIRELVVTIKDELQKDGKLEYDWRAAKAAKLEQKRQKEEASGSAATEDPAAVTAVA